MTALINKTFEHVGVPNVRNFTALLSIKKEIPDVQIFTALPSMTAAPTYYCDVIDFLEICRLGRHLVVALINKTFQHTYLKIKHEDL